MPFWGLPSKPKCECAHFIDQLGAFQLIWRGPAILKSLLYLPNFFPLYFWLLLFPSVAELQLLHHFFRQLWHIPIIGHILQVSHSWYCAWLHSRISLLNSVVHFIRNKLNSGFSSSLLGFQYWNLNQNLEKKGGYHSPTCLVYSLVFPSKSDFDAYIHLFLYIQHIILDLLKHYIYSNTIPESEVTVNFTYESNYQNQFLATKKIY